MSGDAGGEQLLEGLVEHASLKAFTSFGVEASAQYLIQVYELAQLRQAIEFARDNRLPCLVLGEGSNVLFVNDFPGIVLVMRLQGIVREGELLRVAAGENWHRLVEWSLSQELFGLENLALIPGTAGGAPIQNIGAYGVELMRFVERVRVYDTQRAEERCFSAEECDFGYRDSVFKRAPQGRFVVLELELRLSDKDCPELGYGPLAAMFEGKPATARQVFDAVCALRTSKLPDPRLLGNAGSFFKNPIVSLAKVQSLRERWPELPSYPTEDAELLKVPAAWLLETAGWKGAVRGQAAVHEAHALVLVNLGAATGEELFLLAQEMSSSVLQRFGIALQPEVQIL